MATTLQFVGGFVLLLFGAEYLLRGAVSIARKLHISAMVIGMTIVAWGTSAPELMVSLQAALNGVPEIAIGNVIGSNITNVLLVLGVAAAISPIVVNPRDLLNDATMMMFSALLFAALVLSGGIGRWQGAMMLAAMIVFSLYTFVAERRRGTREGPGELAEEFREVPEAIWLAALSVLGGLLALIYGGRFLVLGATSAARFFDVGEEVIALTIVSVGTSLPELATAAVAAYRQNTDVAVGNIVGTNIFNLLAIIGVISIISPVPIPSQITSFDIWFMLGVTATMLALLITRSGLNRWAGIVFLCAFAGYTAIQFYGVEHILP